MDISLYPPPGLYASSEMLGNASGFLLSLGIVLVVEGIHSCEDNWSAVFSSTYT